MSLNTCETDELKVKITALFASIKGEEYFFLKKNKGKTYFFFKKK